MSATREQLEIILNEELDNLTLTEETEFNYLTGLHLLYRRFVGLADSSGLSAAISNKYDAAYFQMQDDGCADQADYRNVMRDFTEKVVRLFGNPGKSEENAPMETEKVKISFYREGTEVTLDIDSLANLLRAAALQGHNASWGDHTDSGIAWHILKDAGII